MSNAAGPRELTVWGFIALLCLLMAVLVLALVSIVGGEFTPPWLLVVTLVLGVPLLIGTVIELATTAANQARLSRLRTLARSRDARAHWIIVADWWDTETLLLLDAELPNRPVLHYDALLTDTGVEIWHRNNQLTTLRWDGIQAANVGFRARLTGIEKLQQGDETLRTWGRKTRETQLQSVRRESRQGSVPQPVLELVVAGIDQPIALSVTGRNPLGPRRAALRRVTELATQVQGFRNRDR